MPGWYALQLLIVTLVVGFMNPPAGAFPVDPFLQNASPSSMWVVWESAGHAVSRVDFGLSEDTLDQSSWGDWVAGAGGTHVHHVQLEGLEPGTRYFYRALTETEQSDVAWFTTPLPVGSDAPFTVVAYSDAQVGNDPTKHEEVVNEGILGFFDPGGAGDIDQAVSFSLVAGDLVGTGSNHGHWQDHFFGQARNLYRHIPLYPALGNHEANAALYYAYMNVPLNGSPGYDEHWYWFDHHNLRVITLDSNPPFDNEVQLDWLDGVLADACGAEHIDFVLAQFHHPHLSESWTPGESAFSSQAVARVEQFSTDCGKVSVHFFGHTHSYSRGQSRDHQHLMVNVASAMGSLDYWYAYPNADYDEFQLTENEWGFCVLDIVGGDDPSLTLTRVSRGNDYLARDNEIRDEITIRSSNIAPGTPTGLSPTVDDEPVPGWDVELIGDAFADGDGDEPLESHWQVSSNALDWSSPVAQDWKRRENWYRPPDGDGWYSVDTVKDPDITRTVLDGLLPGCTTLHWRVRYRDGGLAWSDWSAPVAFEAGESFVGDAAPDPPDGAATVPREPTLSWGTCAGATAWDVYLGFDPVLTEGDLLGTTFLPSMSVGPLDAQTTCYWRIDSHLDGDVLPGPTWSFTTTRSFPTDWTAEWRFIDANPADEEDLVAARGSSRLGPVGLVEGFEWSVGTTGTIVPHIDGVQASFVKVNGVWGENRGLQCWLDAPGDGGDINQFTYIWDLYIEPGQTGRVPLWQGNDANTNQSEFHLDCDTGGFWINGTGLVGQDLWTQGAWFRLVQRVDWNAGESALFVDGQRVLADEALGAPDWLWGGPSGNSTWMFTDDDGAEAGGVRCSAVALVDDLMGDVDIAELGGPDARGIFIDRPSEWRFDDAAPADDIPMQAAMGDSVLTPRGMVQGVDWSTSETGQSVPHIGDQPASYISLDNVYGSGRGLEVFTEMPGNAGLGCCDLGHFTLVWDLYLDTEQDELQALWQGNASNSNDAELFVNCSSGGFYVQGTGYVGSGLWPLGQWFRLVHCVDYQHDTSALFVDGVKVLDNLAAADWVYGGGSGNPIWLLSDNGGATDVSIVQCSAMALVDRLLADEEIASLGGPDAAGIFAVAEEVPCPDDVTGDGVVGVDDVLSIIADWGPCPGCASDVDGNGVVDVDDILSVISAWGDC